MNSSMIDCDLITRICKYLNECVVLLVDNALCKPNKNLIMIFTYIPPERSNAYDTQNDYGIKLLKDNVLMIMSDVRDASYIITDDRNDRVKDKPDYIPDDDIDYILCLRHCLSV